MGRSAAGRGSAWGGARARAARPGSGDPSPSCRRMRSSPPPPVRLPRFLGPLGHGSEGREGRVAEASVGQSILPSPSPSPSPAKPMHELPTRSSALRGPPGRARGALRGPSGVGRLPAARPGSSALHPPVPARTPALPCAAARGPASTSGVEAAPPPAARDPASPASVRCGLRGCAAAQVPRYIASERHAAR